MLLLSYINFLLTDKEKVIIKMIVIIAKEKKNIFPQKACREIYQTNTIISYINRISEIEYIVLGIYCVRSKGQ